MDELNNTFTNETNDTNGRADEIAEKITGTPAAEVPANDTPANCFTQSFEPASPVSAAPKTSEITYAPQKKEKKKKEKKGARLSSVIAVCLAAVLLCGCAGFGGSLLANKVASKAYKSGDTAVNTPLVIYRDTADGEIVESTSGDEVMTYKQVAAAVKNSVVEINTEFTTRSAWFQYVSGGAGSGVIISEDGYIVTNAHVVMNNDSTALADSVTVRLPNGEEYDAAVKGYDIDADIAVIKIEANGLTPAVCGNSDNLAVGEELIVVGNPLGELGGSVTKGIVSATEREIEVSGKKMTLIQTDAAINPGNSGGGMFNMSGKLVGIVNAKSAGSSIEGLGFAIPVNKVLSVSEQLMEFGYVRGKTTIGVTFRTVGNGTFSGYYNIRPGIYVETLVEGMNDDVLKVGDRVIAMNGEEITSASDIVSKVTSSEVGDTITFQLYRDNKLTEVTVTVFEKVPDEQNQIEFSENDESDSAAGPEEYYGDFFSSPIGGLEDFFGGFFGR